MKKVIKELEDVPFEVGSTYLTKFATAEHFTISKIITNTNGEVIKFEVIYDNRPHLGQCPLSVDRLNPTTRLTGNSILIHICPHCNKSFKD